MIVCFEFATYEKAYESITDFTGFYNQRRIPSSIDDLTPYECYELYKEKKVNIKEIRV
ncbi:hypothetical protein [Clostridium sp. 1xD42-85]|uniref:hypothetical protein n=1 Tax=Clostridium sp. 1xD42-85 TaxID=2320084 RepID=UPI001411CC6D|nr:hypothetical protein [Clostridium sp. 1xD42-85]